VHHTGASLSHYSSATADLEFQFPHGWGELWGVANRTDYDLQQHAKHSKLDLSFQTDTESFYPQVIEPSVGLDRLMYAVLSNAYAEETLPDGTVREVLRLHPQLAPCKFAVLPLLRNAEMLTAATGIRDSLLRLVATEMNVSGSIGKRYRRHDEVGTPYCVTIDRETLANQTVTIRDRDSMSQERISVDALINRARLLKLDE
jgi:glycyl-tRNA synthetase